MHAGTQQAAPDPALTTYWVLWTFLANFASKPTEVEATDIVDAIKKSTFYDPYGKSDGCGAMMTFHIFNREVGHVFTGTILDAEKELETDV